MLSGFHSARSHMREWAGRYPAIFYSTYGLKYPNNTLVVRRDTQLVIEGYPRCANTFSVLAFERMQPSPIKIAHHLHAPSQIHRAAKWNIPTLLLIRNPRDAVSSLIVRNPELSIKFALESYITFYSMALEHSDDFVVGCFNDVISSFDLIIKRVNKKFNKEFVFHDLSITDEKEIFSSIEQLSKSRVSGVRTRAAYPSTEKRPLKKIALQKITHSSHMTLLAESEEIYNDFIILSRQR